MATITSTDGNDNLNGGSGADVINGGAGNDKISGGSGNDTLDGGSGNDIVNGDSGDDILVYRLSENSGSSDVYTGGSGIDTIRLMLTNDEWLNASVQTQIGQYLQHLAAVTNAKTMEVSNGSASDFTFNFISVTGKMTTLTIQMTEKLDVWVDESRIDFHRINITSDEQKGAVVEDAVGVAKDAITFTDVDLAQNHTATFAAAAGNTTTLGTFTIAPVSEGANAANGSVGWTYTLDNAKAQYLAAGQTVTETYAVTVRDDAGLTSTQNVVITITGTNDIATVSSESKALTEGNTAAAISTSGKLSISDVDTGEAHVVAQAATAGVYGTFAINADGAWTYTASSAHNELSAGQQVIEEFTVVSQDGTGSGKVTITITGSNDAATITASATEDTTVVEAGGVANGTVNDASASGTLTVHDVDAGQAVFAAVAPAALAGTYGDFTFNSATGAWTYALDNTRAATQALTAGQPVTDTLTVSSIDTTASQTITVNITGSNDAATITASATEDTTVVEAGGIANGTVNDASASGTLTVHDVDAGQAAFAIVAPAALAGTYGDFTFNSATGAWTYALDNTRAATQALTAGQPVTDTLTVSSIDTTASQTITVNITGSNDAATITASATEDTTVVEAGGIANGTVNDASASGTLTVHDVDAGQAVFAAVAPAALAGTYGDFTFNSATGAWTYALDNTRAATQALTAGQPVTDTLTVSSVDTTASQTITVNITGSNDAATITASATEDTTVVEAGGIANGTVNDASASGTLTVHDVDAGQAVFAAVAPAALAGTYGDFTFNSATGAWTYALDNTRAATQALTAGQPVTDTLTVSSSDTTASQTITVNITGSNDAATITASATEDTTVVEAGGIANGTVNDASASGTLTVHDVDAGQAVFAIVAPAALAGTYGDFTFNSATGAWTYALDNTRAATQALTAGQPVTDTLTVSSIDTTASQTITVNITGSNDAATITASATEDTTVVEAGGIANGTVNDASASGTLTVHDVDAGQAAFAIVAPAALAGTYGDFTFNSATGAWTYALDNTRAATQALTAGQPVTDTLTVSSIDTTASQTITVNITGSNDAATITASATEDTTVVEAGGIANGTVNDASASGTLTVHDVDAGQAVFAAVAPAALAGTYGDFTFNSATGAWTYALDNTRAATQALTAGQPVTDTLTVSSVDTTASQTITVNITGSNDAATITASATEDTTVVEAGGIANGTVNDASASGTLTVHDVDAGQAVFAAVAPAALAGTYGDFTFNSATGAWTYALDNTRAATQALTAGQPVTDTLTVSSSDTTASQTITVNITGSNDAATITASATEDTTVVEAGGIANGTVNDASASGTLTVHDVDAGQAVFAIVAPAALAGTYGDFTFNSATGAWTYALDNTRAATQALTAGQPVTDTLTVSSIDTTASQTITVNITGSNDAATITASATEDTTVVEAGGIANGTVNDASASGTLTVHDVDAGQAVFAAVAPAALAGTYGDFTFNSATGAWTYALDNTRAATQALTAGQPVTDTLTVSSIDTTASQTITVNITGSNDAATITASATEDTTVVEAGGIANGTVNDASASGTLTVHDVDAGQAAFAIVAPAALAGTYGDFTFNSATGAWTYALDNTRAATQALTAGQPVTDTLTVSSIDTTASQTITVNITGSNDAATITASATEDTTVVEAGGIANGTVNDASASGTLTVHDVDAGQAVFAAVAPAALAGTYGDFTFNSATGAWTYALDNTRAATQALTAGQPVTDTLTVSSVDTTASQTITVNITGSNDAATITASATEDTTVVEAGGIANGTVNDASASGTLTVHDVDAGQAVFAAVAPAALAGTYGDFTFNSATGAWTYALDNTRAATQALTAGQPVTDTLTVSSSDTTASQTITVNITGSNDAATITASATEDTTVVEAGGIANGTVNDASASGTLTVHDVDAGQAVFAIVAPAALAGTYGDFTFNSATGAWTYALDNTRAATQALTAGQPVTDTLTVSSIDTTASQTITVNITGSNDAATITASATEDTTVVEAGGIANGTVNDASASGTLTVHDVDAGQAAFAIVAPAALAGTYGDFTFNSATGAWTYALDNTRAATQALTAGQPVTDTLTVSSVDTTASQTITVNITGSNDAATITASATEDTTVVEAGGIANGTVNDASASGTLTVHDVDAGQAVFAAVAPAALAGTYGDFTFNSATGAWTYALDNTRAATQALTAGQPVTDTLTVSSSDTTASQTITVNITGSNDAATITASATEDTTVVEAGGVANGTAGDATAGGTLTVHDVDAGQAVFAAVTSEALKGTYGDFTFNSATGAWTYALDNTRAATQALTAGQPVTDTLTVSSVDTTASQTITVNITGSNDAATITASATEDTTVVEAGGVANGTAGDATAGGTLTVHDVDAGQAVFAAVTSEALKGTYGDFTFNSATGAWTYALDNTRAATQALTAGQPVTDTLTVSSVDTTASQTITVNITGSNDAATITASATEDTTVVEAGGIANGTVNDASASGTLTVHDVDAGQAVFAAVAPAALAGTYGDFTFNSATGAWTYALDNTRAATQALTAGQPVTDTLTVSSSDTTASQTITVNITGSNDAATITASATEDTTVVEAGGVANGTAGDATAGGTLTVHDVDAGQAVFAAVTSEALKGTYGDFTFNSATGAWTYALDNTRAATQALTAGQPVTDTLTVSSVDTTASQTITVNITGSNDAATITASATEDTTVVEAGGIANGTVNDASASGTLTVHDVDAGQAAFAIVAPAALAGTYGDFTFNSATGAWTYALDNTRAATQALTAGQPVTDTLTVSSIDTTASQTITVNITGSNDAATITASATEDTTVVEAGGIANGTVNDASASGTLTVHDVDAGQAVFAAVAPAALAGTYGDFTFNSATGAWTYALDNTRAATQALTAGQPVTDTLTVSSSDTTASQTITVNITGSNDAATITASATEDTTVVEAGGIANGTVNDASASGTLTVHDVDAGQAVFAIVAPAALAGTYGDFTFNSATGAWTYALDNTRAATQALTAGQPVTDTLTVSSIDTTASQTITVNITGSNDAATITASATEDTTVVEAGGIANGTVNDASASGTLTVHDVDAGQAAFAIVAPAALAGTYGDFTFNSATGAWTYALDNTRAATQALTAGQPVTDTLTVSSVDTTASQTITVNITGSNDAAVIGGTSTGTVTEAGGVANATVGTPTATGTLTSADVDNAANTFMAVAAGTASTAGYGTYAMTEGGVWTYTLNNANATVQALNATDTLTDTFTVKSVDGTQKVVSVTINGANDAAVIGTPSVSSVKEDVSVNGLGNLTASGSISISDADQGQASFKTTVTSAQGNLGGLVLATDGSYTYTVGNNQVQQLGGTDSKVEIFTVTALDGTTKEVSFTINGTNDNPTVTAAAQSAQLVEAGVGTAGTATASITLTKGDVDTSDSAIYDGTALIANNWATANSGTTYTKTGTYGTATLTTATGVVSYALDNADPDTNNLAGGASASDNFTVYVRDGSTGTASTAVNFAIRGTNDNPTVTAGAQSAQLVEAGVGTQGTAAATITLTKGDVDTGDSAVYDSTALIANGWATSNSGITYTKTGTYGAATLTTSSGVVSYALDNADPDTNNLAGGASASDNFTVYVKDGSTGTASTAVNFSITGTNDASGDTTSPFAITPATVDKVNNNNDRTVLLTFSEPLKAGTFTTADVEVSGGGTVSSVTPVAGSNNTKFTVLVTGVGNPGTESTLRVLAGGYTDVNDNPGLASNAIVIKNPGTQAFPAGAAGSPINLALSDPSVDAHDPVTVLVSGVPSDWVLNSGTNNGDGTWTVQTNDPASLTVTTPLNFAGAMVLGITMGWTNPDGSAGTLFVNNNVEAYAPSNPIFAVSSEDNLSGSSAADLFVFAQPSSYNKIFSFDAAHDKIGLIGFTNVNNFANLGIADDADGNAVITTSPGSTITVLGVQAAELSAANFEFNVEPATVNNGTMTISNGAILPLGGVVENTGTIVLGSTGSETRLQVLVESVKLQGHGHVQLSDDANNVIFGGASNAKLVNIDNTISGAGQIGAGKMTLENHAAIIADGSHALVIDTGANIVANAGTLEATGAGGLVVESDIANDGKLWANGGNITVHGDVTGAGTALISGSAALELDGTAHVAVSFADNGAGTLKLGDADHFSGTIAGFGDGDSIDLADIGFDANATLTYLTDTPGRGMLTIGDGAATAHLALQGAYGNAGFHAVQDQNGGTLLTVNATDVNQHLQGGLGMDILVTGAGNDTLAGGAGNDVLFGGGGNDNFVFATAPNGLAHVDTILDFKANGDADQITLSQLVFASLHAVDGTLDAAQFASVADGSGGNATFDAGVHVIYDSQTGNLYYDADGGDTAAGRDLLAVLGTASHPAVVDHNDIKIG